MRSRPVQAVTCIGLLLQIMRVVQVKPAMAQAPAMDTLALLLTLEALSFPPSPILVDRLHNLSVKRDAPPMKLAPRPLPLR
jgi:hypothetical protein